ncbi:hypothetical protein KRP22_000329 [Phytophthora ramorum]|nr:hypothetical protein KRP22_12275 [Phytophthora ramorum]
MQRKALAFESTPVHSALDMSSEATDFERGPPDSGGGFVKIGGPLPDASDPRTIKGASSTPGNGHRLFYLRVIDSRKWHYSETFALFLDFFVQVLTISFTQKATFHDEVAAKASRYFSSGLMLCYFIDMVIRVLGLRLALFRSHSNIADLLCLLAMVVLLGSRHVMGDKEYWLCLGYLTIVACRLILKPRARTFSKKLHKFRTNGDHIRVSIESLRASLARIPGISAMSIEMMETDLVIICGRDEGDMTRDELMNFLERALHYRPPNLSATEFLSHLRDIDASSSTLAYGITDVVRSTLWHWSTQTADLLFCFFVVCINASVSPALAIFLAKLSDAFDTLDSGSPNESTLKIGVVGVLALCVPFVLGDYAVGYFQSKMISKATESMQSALLNIILRQDTQFFAERSEGDLNNLFSSDVARVNALWQAVFWNLLNPLVAVIFGFGYALYMDASIGIMSFGFTAVLLSSGPQGFAAQRSKEFGSRNAYVAAEFQNAVGCEKVVRAYAIQDPLISRFKKTCSALRKSQFSKDFWSSIVQIYIESAMYIFVAIMTASLAMKVWHKELSSGEFFGFITLLSRVSNPVTVLGGFMRVAIGNASSLQRVDDIIVGLGSSTGGDEADKDMPPLPKMEQNLRVEKLVFKYDKASENYILNELSATIPREGRYDALVQKGGLFYEMVHKVDKPEEEEDVAPVEKTDMVSMAKSRRRGTGPRRNTDTIGATGEEPKQMHDSALALQQFTKTLSSRVVHDVGDGTRPAGTTSWYRYGNRQSHRSRKTSEDGFTSRRSGNNSVEGGQWYPSHHERGAATSAASEEERNKYFVL